MREFFKYHTLMWYFLYTVIFRRWNGWNCSKCFFFIMKTDEDNSQLSQCGSWKGEDFQINITFLKKILNSIIYQFIYLYDFYP